MDETPDEPLGPDDDHGGSQDEPTTTNAWGEPPPSGSPDDPTTPNPMTPNPPGGLPPPGDDADNDADDDEDEDEDDETVPTRRRFLSGSRLLAVGVVVLALLGGGVGFAFIGGGGGDDDDSGGDQADTEQSMEDAAFEFAQCMRDHGIEDFPDPEVDSNGGMSIGGPGGGGPDELSPQEQEEMQAAQEACQSILDDAMPEGQELTPEEQAEMQDQALAMAQCMRDKGWEDFPDPEINEDGGMGIQLGPDSGLPRPGDPNADQFQQDQEDCIDEAGLGRPGPAGDGPEAQSGSEEPGA
jgi:hypothetical protein